MTRVSVKQARESFKKLLDEVEAGGQVIILRRGKEVARLVPPASTRKRPRPDLGAFRASIRVKGEPLSRTVIRARREDCGSSPAIGR
jgi:prevent-host-death family protein